MSNTGPLSPSHSVDQGDNFQVWAFPNNVFVSDGIFATVQFNTSLINQISDSLFITGFGAAVPTGAAINGVTASVIRGCTNNLDGTAVVRDNPIYLVSGGVIIGSSRANLINWEAAPSTINYGGISDVWGASLSSSIVNANDFGLSIGCNVAAPGFGNTSIFGIDYASITIYYTVPTNFSGVIVTDA